MNALLSVKDAARFLGISPWTLRLYVKNRIVIPVRLGRRVLLEPEELQNFIQKHRCPQ